MSKKLRELYSETTEAGRFMVTTRLYAFEPDVYPFETFYVVDQKVRLASNEKLVEQPREVLQLAQRDCDAIKYVIELHGGLVGKYEDYQARERADAEFEAENAERDEALLEQDARQATGTLGEAAP